MSNTFHMGKVRYLGYSDNAFAAMLNAKRDLDMGEIWAAHRPTSRPVPACAQPGCAAVLHAA